MPCITPYFRDSIHYDNSFVLPNKIKCFRCISYGYDDSTWILLQNKGQKIIFGSCQTTKGTKGYIASTKPGNYVMLKTIYENKLFIVVDSYGDILIV